MMATLRFISQDYSQVFMGQELRHKNECYLMIRVLLIEDLNYYVIYFLNEKKRADFFEVRDAFMAKKWVILLPIPDADDPVSFYSMPTIRSYVWFSRQSHTRSLLFGFILRSRPLPQNRHHRQNLDRRS